MNLIQLARELFPTMTDKEIDFTLWELTCFPFDNQRAAEQLRKLARRCADDTQS